MGNLISSNHTRSDVDHPAFTNEQSIEDRDLSLVNTIGKDCRIYRETCGRYVVSLDEDPRHRREVATLACAYATCRSWEHPHPPASTGGPAPPP